MPPLNKLTDQELSARVKTGDQAAFTELYDRYKEPLYRHAYRWLQDRETVKDTIQEIFALIWNKREQLSIDQNPSGYLYTSARHAILRKISQREDARDHYYALEEYAARPENEPDFRVRAKQLQALIDEQVSQLPPRMRQIFELSRYQQLSHAEIAELLNISEQTVRTQIKYALRILREKLGLLIYLYLLFKG